MRVLFLDIDGVLNSVSWQKRRRAEEVAARAEAGIVRHDEKIVSPSPAVWQGMLDPVAVARLNRVLALTGVTVVVSSSWRTMLTPDELRSSLEARGFSGHIIGHTPEMADKTRGHEILSWLMSTQAEVQCWAVLDDDAVPLVGAALVRTSDHFGLTDDDSERLIAMLDRNRSRRERRDSL